MTRPEPVRFMRTEAAMAFPDGRLLAVAGTVVHVLTADGWSRLAGAVPAGAVGVTRAEAEARCERSGWDPSVLGAVPAQPG